jgi:hypothetical protein
VLHVSDDIKDDLDKPGGPLESFGQRITIGRALGIYGEHTEYNLDLLRLIRNSFAHAHVPITFETREIVAAVDLFRNVPLLPPHNMGAERAPVPTVTRAKFHHFCQLISHNLIVWGWASRAIQSDLPIPPDCVGFIQPNPMP